MRRVALLLAGVLLLAVQPAGAAVSHPKKTVLARGIGAGAADGGHLVGWGGSHGQLALYDDRDGTKSRLDLDRSCTRVVTLAAAGGAFLISCGTNGAAGAQTIPIVFDTATGTSVVLPDAVYDTMGTQWVEGTTESGGRSVVMYANWHTGEIRSEGEAPSGEVRTPFDLDSENLDAVALAAVNFAVGSGRALEQVRSGRRYSVHLMGRMDDKRIANCSHKCLPLSMTGGLALWSDGDTRLFGYELRSPHRLRQWSVSDTATVVGVTKKRIYYLTPSSASPQFQDLRSFAWH
jgi:hypothetical protein